MLLSKELPNNCLTSFRPHLWLSVVFRWFKATLFLTIPNSDRCHVYPFVQHCLKILFCVVKWNYCVKFCQNQILYLLTIRTRPIVSQKIAFNDRGIMDKSSVIEAKKCTFKSRYLQSKCIMILNWLKYFIIILFNH